MKLLPLQDLTKEDLPFVCDPVHARFWLHNAFRAYVRIEGFGEHLDNCEWEACQLEGDPDHWNGRLLGYERLLDYIKRGSLVLVIEPGDLPLHPIDRAFVNTADGRFEPDLDNIWEPEIHGRFQYHIDRVYHEHQEQERYATNHPPTRAPDIVPAVGPGSRKATLGPHDGLHNQDWQTVQVKRESFKTVKQVDMESLSREDAIARKALKGQGWDAKKTEQVLNSGDRFAAKELKPGDKLRSFDTNGKEKDLQKSAYWMDEAEFKNVESKFFKNGQWDKEGVKNHLALPCFNRATDVTTVQVTQPTTGLTSTVGKARELVKYTDSSGYTTGMIGKIMGGGGKQITVNPAHVTKV